MDFSDEPYVRLYTTDTTTWHMLEWEGQCVLMQMLRRFDRAGVFACGKHAPVKAIVAATRMPRKVVEVGLRHLLDEQVWLLRGDALVWPKYLKAQTCARSDRVRKLDERARRAAGAVTDCDGVARPENELPESNVGSVTHRDDKSRLVTAVTDGHKLSTQYSTVQYRSEAGAEGESEGEPRAKPAVAARRRSSRHKSEELKPRELSEDWAPEAEQASALATKWQVPERRILSELAEFRWYWRSGKGAGTRRAASGWASAFANRISSQAKSGDLYVEPLPAVRSEGKVVTLRNDDDQEARIRASMGET